MSVEIRSGDLTDPLNGYSISLLLPQTLKDLKPTENPKFGELPSYFKSLVSKNSHNLLEQVKTIRKGSSEFHRTEIQHSMQSEDEFIDVPAVAKDRPQARRPALSTKRARFSMKPITSQPSLVEDMSFNVDQLKDPEELFSAFESHERAKEELQKQGAGVSVYSSQHMLSTTARRRRPRIREGKVSYKHRYSSESADHSESLLTSQGTFNMDISSPSYSVSTIDAAYQLGASQEGDTSGVQDSIAEAESRLGDPLDLERLLSDNGTDLDGDGTISFLKKHLKLQPIQSGNISDAELDNLCNNPLSRPRTPFSDIHNVVTGVKNKRHVEAHQHGEISANLLASRITSKSPLLSLQKLKRDACQKSDPFSFRGIDGLAPSSNLDDSIDNTIGPTPAEVNGSGLSFSGKLQSLMAGKAMNVQRTMDTGQTATKELPRALDPIDVDSSDIHMDPKPKRSYVFFTDKDEDPQKGTLDLSGELEPGCGGLTMEKLQACYSDPAVGENHAENGHDDIIVPEENTQIQQEIPTVSSSEESKQNVPTRTERKRKNVSSRKSPSDNSSSAAGINNGLEGNPTIDVNVPEDNNEAQQTPLVSSSFKNKPKAPACNGRKRTNLLDRKNMADKSDATAGEKCADGGYSEASVICPDQNNEEPTMALLSVEKKKKASARVGRRRRELVRRKSLEGAGTAWQSGVRRSTRNRSRPLQYWKGERFLYGRVHESLLTVIGLKYESPTKPSGDPTFKVKYFVSDEYKQLVDSQALH